MSTFTKDALLQEVERYGWSIGDYTYGVPYIHWPEGAKLRIGKYCSIAQKVEIFLGGNHRTDWVSTFPFPYIDPQAAPHDGHPSSRGDVVIGNDVWIANSVIIVSGVTVGNGACLAAGSVVGRDIPAYCVAGGNPARPLRQRFSDRHIARLEAVAWWDWPTERIRRHHPLLMSGDVEAFLAAAERETGQPPAPAPSRFGRWLRGGA